MQFNDLAVNSPFSILLTMQREVEAIFKKINEGVDLFDYYYSRHENSNNDSQKEKLEGDLKKEIKKLQKYREQIKGWQANEAIEAIIAPNKLQEHRRMVEEAMETYKDVEKNSKMKTFSNQSILLASREQNDDLRHLSGEAIETIGYLETSLESLESQISELDEEYEKLNEKRSKRANHTIEERKQEIDHYNQNNHFHVSQISTLIQLIKEKRINPELVWSIQEDLNFYIESNQEPDFINDDTFYDDIFKEVSSIPLDFNGDENVDDGTLVDTSIMSSEPTANNTNISILSNHEAGANEHSNIGENGSSQSFLTRSNPNSAISTPVKKQPVDIPMPKIPTTNSKLDISSVDSSPAIVKTLKPAVTPSAPVGNIKWSVAAAAGGSLNEGMISDSRSHTFNEGKVDKQNGILRFNGNVRNPERNLAQYKNYANSNYIDVLRNSLLTENELELFSDVNLIKVPPGVQDLIISFSSTRNQSESSRFLTHTYNKYTTPILKDYLPTIIQTQDSGFKTPLALMKLQSYWNKIRANNQFDLFVDEIQQFIAQDTLENTAIINELTFVLFYGYYYALTPLENIIAESCLFKLNWKPYGVKGDQIQHHQISQHQRQPRLAQYRNLNQYFYWFNCIKTLPKLSHEGGSDDSMFEFGDYKVFDLLSWEIYIKHGFKFDYSLCQLEPSKSI